LCLFLVIRPLSSQKCHLKYFLGHTSSAKNTPNPIHGGPPNHSRPNLLGVNPPHNKCVKPSVCCEGADVFFIRKNKIKALAECFSKASSGGPDQRKSYEIDRPRPKKKKVIVSLLLLAKKALVS